MPTHYNNIYLKPRIHLCVLAFHLLLSLVESLACFSFGCCSFEREFYDLSRPEGVLENQVRIVVVCGHDESPAYISWLRAEPFFFWTTFSRNNLKSTKCVKKYDPTIWIYTNRIGRFKIDPRWWKSDEKLGKATRSWENRSKVGKSRPTVGQEGPFMLTASGFLKNPTKVTRFREFFDFGSLLVHFWSLFSRDPPFL